ncbi:hypothetical protein D3C77_685200 [compost metagenome]
MYCATDPGSRYGDAPEDKLPPRLSVQMVRPLRLTCTSSIAGCDAVKRSCLPCSIESLTGTMARASTVGRNINAWTRPGT